jgi:hypothetical protein
MPDRGIMALIFGVFCAAMGTMLGLRFKVIILVPFIVLVMVGTAAVEVALGANLWSIVGAMIVSVIVLQIGYVMGVIAYASLGSVSTRVHRQITTEKFGQAIRFDS